MKGESVWRRERFWVMDVIKCVLKVRSGAMQETGGSSAGFLGGDAPPARDTRAHSRGEGTLRLTGRWGPRRLSASCREETASASTGLGSPGAASEMKTKTRGVPGASSSVSPPLASVSRRPQRPGGAADSSQVDCVLFDARRGHTSRRKPGRGLSLAFQ